MLNLPFNNKDKHVDIIACEKCQCTWFTKLQINRYSTVPQSLRMQPVPIHYDADFNLLMCVKCNNVVFPPTESFRAGSALNKLYDDMVTEVTETEEEKIQRLAGTSVQKKTPGVFAHVPEHRDTDDGEFSK